MAPSSSPSSRQWRRPACPALSSRRRRRAAPPAPPAAPAAPAAGNTSLSCLNEARTLVRAFSLGWDASFPCVVRSQSRARVGDATSPSRSGDREVTAPSFRTDRSPAPRLPIGGGVRTPGKFHHRGTQAQRRPHPEVPRSTFVALCLCGETSGFRPEIRIGTARSGPS